MYIETSLTEELRNTLLDAFWRGLRPRDYSFKIKDDDDEVILSFGGMTFSKKLSNPVRFPRIALRYFWKSGIPVQVVLDGEYPSGDINRLITKYKLPTKDVTTVLEHFVNKIDDGRCQVRIIKDLDVYLLIVCNNNVYRISPESLREVLDFFKELCNWHYSSTVYNCLTEPAVMKCKSIFA